MKVTLNLLHKGVATGHMKDTHPRPLQWISTLVLGQTGCLECPLLIRQLSECPSCQNKTPKQHEVPTYPHSP